DPNISNPNASGWFNTAAFAPPAAYTFGNLGRYAMRSSTFWNIDFSIFKEFKIHENLAVDLRLESFNLPNTVILGVPNGNVLDPNFSKITGTANAPRSLQLGLKVIF
ncbi:MAG: hypothetical protein ABI165_09500, partial [Bryobacteraceae bacterium]